MAFKKKKVSAASCPILPPQVFETSLAKLNIHIARPKVSNESTTGSTELDGGGGSTVYCTAEAMEFLRQCHSQFVALVSSELASGQDSVPMKKRKASEKDGDNGANTIRTIMPNHIKPALERLEFHDINLEIFEELQNSSAGGMDSGAIKGKSKVTPKSEPSSRKQSKATRVKNSIKNSAMTEALMKEQEKLFAMSVARAKESQKES